MMDKQTPKIKNRLVNGAGLMQRTLCFFLKRKKACSPKEQALYFER